MTENETRPISFQPTMIRPLHESWAGWFLVYVALIVLPCWLSHSFVMNAVLREENAQMRSIARELNSRAQGLARIYHAGNGFVRSFSSMLGKSSSEFLSWVTDLETKYPGAFRWMAWDGSGRLLEIPGNCRLPGSRYWSEVASQLARHLSVSNIPEEERFPVQAALDRLQPFFGKSLSLNSFFARRKEVIPIRFLGQEALAGWITFNQSASESVSGIVLFAFLPRLPEEYFLLQSVNPALFNDPGAELAIINLREPQGDYVPKAIADRERFAVELRDTYQARHEQTFRVRNYLVHPLPAPSDQIHRLFLLHCIDDLRDGAAARRWFWNQVLAGIWAFGTLCMIVLYRGAARDLSLRWKIAGLFFAAISLPLLIFMQTSLSWDALEWESGVAELTDRLRETETILQERYKDFPVFYTHQHTTLLQQALDKGIDEPGLVQMLDQLVRDREISCYYLTDAKGNIPFSRTQSSDTKQMSIVRILVRHTFNTECAVNESQGILQSALTDEMNALKTGSNEDGEQADVGKSTTLRVGHVQEINFRSPSYFVYLIPRFNDQPRVLMLQYSYKNMRAAFGRSEFAQQRFRAAEPSIQLEFFSNESDFASLPASSSLRSQRDIAEILTSGKTFVGVVTVDTRPLLCLVSGTGGVMLPILTTSLEPLHKQQQARRVEMLALGGVGATVALVLGFLLSGALIGPIKRLEWGMERVGEDALDVVLTVESKDELGRMHHRFNEMVRGLRERERMRAYVSESVQERVKQDGPGGGNLGEAVETTILFSDIRGFTTLCERHEPQAIFGMLNELLGGAERIIREEGGHVDKFIGDAVMAVFFQSGPEKAVAATRAAVRIMAFLETLNRERRERRRFEIAVGIGINTGTALMGDVGSERRKDLTVIGDAVNLAARLESCSREGRHTHIILSETTVTLLGDRVTAEELSLTSVKGKEKAVRMYELVRMNDEDQGDDAS